MTPRMLSLESRLLANSLNLKHMENCELIFVTIVSIAVVDTNLFRNNLIKIIND
jgi:hypothetical protein